ncbi:glycoside hydrolase family 92 protein [Plenodomus tracheiphilus IPT5]|uniref:Glycoside hydrolase family 92 protein n=1 Tax=Plenodomus tracheiphilus IPT5 TaxID=1408161 RepID=A0A6A7B709_9PLEO|nr:glycoside hydrolase family 92 protein [Plenodomus tracheiphilus IPT5]
MPRHRHIPTLTKALLSSSLISIAYTTADSPASPPLWTFVDPLIGTVGPRPGSAIAGGNSFPGASLPWGMAKPGIDTSYLGLANGTAVDANAGYTPLGNVTAVSMTHVSGSGGAPTYGLISQMPLLGTLSNINLADNTTYATNRSLDSESATVGLFTTVLANGIKIEITAGNHTGFIRYTFPTPQPSNPPNNVSTTMHHDLDNNNNHANENDIHILTDLTHTLPAYTAMSYTQQFLEGNIQINPSSYHGSASYTGGWSQPSLHTLHFCANFSIPATSPLSPTSAYVQQNTANAVEGAGTLSWPYNAFQAPKFAARPVPRSFRGVRSGAGGGMGIGALFSWTRDQRLGSASASGNGVGNGTADAVVEARIGISYISAARACSHIDAELPASKSFERVVDEARQEWEDGVLSRIEVVDDGHVTSGNATLKRMLYSALYQTGLMPTDKTGENPRWESGEARPYYDDHYTLWDTYRTLLPLYHLIFTKPYSRILSGLISIFTHEGFLPAGRAANWNGRVQGGTHADIVLADGYLKSVRTLSGTPGRGELDAGLDWQEAYRAVMKDATEMPEHNVDPVTFDGATKEGRGALDDYLSLHYITRNHTRSVSRGVEYSQNDFAIYSMATALGMPNSTISQLRDRATWWQNQWNPSANTTLSGFGTFTGFPAPRNSDGSWNLTAYDPLSCGTCGWDADVYEAKIWETAFGAAPHDMARIIELMGGDEAFVRRLDASFVPGFGTSVGANNDAGSALFNPGNEPSFPTPFLYNYVPGMHWKTVNQTRNTVDTFYSDARNGYPGNIDGGALPSWLIFNLMGIFPVPGQPLYLLSAPRFSQLKVGLFGGTKAETELKIVARNLSDTSFYPQKVLLDEKELDRAWLSHDEVAAGGELVFFMGSEPKMWDTGSRPWALSTWA